MGFLLGKGKAVSKSKFTDITIEGARTNNLKDVNLKLPINKITCIYGPSGSGKSSLAFGTLVDESKRRYLNSLPNDIKFLWNIPPSADVDRIEPILPVWALAQINPVVGSRPVVSDLLGITELVVRFFTMNGTYKCGVCHSEIVRLGLGDHLEKWLKNVDDSEVVHFFIKKDVYKNLAPEGFPVRSTKGERTKISELEEDHEFWEIVRAKRKNIKKAIERAQEFLGESKPEILIKILSSKKFTKFQNTGIFCSNCSEAYTPSDYSPDKFNPLVASGACMECDGFGQILDYDLKKIIKNEKLNLDEGAIPLLTYKQFFHLMDDFKRDLKKAGMNPNLPWEKLNSKKYKILEKGGKTFCGLEQIYSYLESKKYKRSVRILSRRLKSETECDVCEGTRLKSDGLFLELDSLGINEVLKSTVNEIYSALKKYKKSKDQTIKKILFSLETAVDLGLGNTRLNRKVKTLSSGEYQRLLLVKILSQQGTGMLFVLDEPSRGLSHKEQSILIDKLSQLRNQGNTVAIVDHSRFLQRSCDYLVEMGPGAGSFGGEVLSLKKPVGKKEVFHKVTKEKVEKSRSYIEFTGVEIFEKKFKKIRTPLNVINWVTGDSGTGKSLFFKYVLYSHLEKLHTGAKPFEQEYSFSKFHTTNVIEGMSYFDPELRTASSRSTVGTFIGFSEIIRKHFASLPVSQKLGLEAGCFSPNSELGKCLTCEGKGFLEIDMQFLENLNVKCEDCDGKKLKRDISSISNGKFTVDEAYNMPLLEVLSYLDLTPKFKKLVEYTKLLNLSHLSLSRSLKSLSGGERLRLQFLKNLNLKSTGEIFIFDNLSIGLSDKELEGVCSILEELRNKKNTVVIIDSNPYFSKISENSIDFNKL